MLEGDGQWERTEDRTEAGGSNSNHTDEACSPYVWATHGQWQAPESIIMETAAFPATLTFSPPKFPGGCRRKILVLDCGGVGGKRKRFLTVPASPSPPSSGQFGNIRVAVPRFPIRFGFYDINTREVSYVYPISIPL